MFYLLTCWLALCRSHRWRLRERSECEFWLLSQRSPTWLPLVYSLNQNSKLPVNNTVL